MQAPPTIVHCLAWILGGLLVQCSRTQADEPVNVLIIQTDEHNFRTLGCYRDTLPIEQARIWGEQAIVETPAIDSVAARGALFTSFYATSPVCTPSRAAFFTGKYPQNTGSFQNNRPLNNDAITFAAVLQQQGYATGYAGKWHLDGAGKPQWAPERKFGFEDNRYMFNRGHWKKFERIDGRPRVAARNKQNEPTYNLDGADERTFATDWLTDRAIDFVRNHARTPFCFHLSLPDPHGPNSVRAPYDTMFLDLPIKPPLTFSMAQENPAWANASGNNRVRFNARQMALYFGMVRCIDDNVGRILATLDELELTSKTVLVFTSDHGDLCYEHGRLNKGNPYEGSARIPFIIAAPGKIAAGTQVDQACGTVDFLPTILSLLNISCPPEVQGRDLTPLFADAPAEGWQDVTFLRAASEKPAWLAAASDRFKLVVAVNEEPWLFDLERDPDELQNWCSQAEHRTTVAELAQHLLDYGRRTQDPQALSGPLHTQLLDLAESAASR